MDACNYGNIILDAHNEHKLTLLSVKNKTEKYIYNEPRISRCVRSTTDISHAKTIKSHFTLVK